MMNLSVSPHAHPESPLTGSTLSAMLDKAKSLGRTHFAYTDMGHLSSCLKAYEQCKKKDLKFIPGIEIFFKDAQCPYISGTPAERCKYFNATIYCKDQEAYQSLVRMVSRTDFPTIEIYEQIQQLWSWKDLQEISQYNVDLVTGGVHCMVGKCMLADAPQAGQKIFFRLKELFGDNFFVSILAEPWTKKWSQVVEIVYADGTKDSLLSTDTVTTDRARRIKAFDLTERSGHNIIKSLSKGMSFYEVDKEIKSVTLHKGFLPLGVDASLKVNKFLVALSRQNMEQVLVTDYAFYASKEDKIVQTMRLEGKNKLQPNLYMKNAEEISEYLVNILNFNPEEVNYTLQNNSRWASRYNGLTLKYEWRLAKAEGSAVQQLMKIAKETGRMKWDDPKYVERLKEELSVIHSNGIYDLSPYFLPIRDVLNHYKENGELTGPGRGSAGGSLLCYITGITNLDPIEYELPFQRFFSMVRIKGKKLPDIDVDIADSTLLTGLDGKSGYLYGRWGDKAARISTRSTIRLKSAIKDTNRYFFGQVDPEIEKLSKGFDTPPQGVSDRDYVFGYEDTDGEHIPGIIEQSTELQDYITNRPKEWEIVSKSMGINRSFSMHASAYILSDIPIKDVVPTKDGYVTQYEAKECELAGLIKYDFLVVKQLKDIRVCLDLINKKNNETHTVGYFSHKGKLEYVWNLPKDHSVCKSIWNGSTETLFQINTASMKPYVIEMKPNNLMDIATILALVRPGPMDFVDPNTGRNMVDEYMMRRRGESEPDIKELGELLPNTLGTLCYQEDLGKIARGLAGFSGEDAELLRENMAKKKMAELMKMKPLFIEGALKKVSVETAEAIWDRMITFGRYGFSVIHACFTENQLVSTDQGILPMKLAYESGAKFAYFDGQDIKYERPSHWFDQGEKEVLQIELEDGRIIECTEDHKFLDEDGQWRTAKEMLSRGYFYAPYSLLSSSTKSIAKIKIKSVKAIGLKPVYDVEMPTKHNFILDSGIVAHNCEYAHITYACMFLKHYYPLEWWAAILTNAGEKEITETFWPYVKDIVLPPDINLSGDEMVVDYANEKIRSKLGVIRGMGEATIGPIVEGRPYKDIQDFVNKEVSGKGLAHKLIHVGVLDSLFPPKIGLLEKLKMYEDAVEYKKNVDKLENAKLTGKKLRKLEPNEGKVPEEYLNLHPIVDAAMKKAVLPSLPIDLYALGRKHSKVLVAGSEKHPMVYNEKGYKTLLVPGKQLKILDEHPGDGIEKDVYVACTCFVVKASEFQYSQGTKRALKLILDADGIVLPEKVLWPAYDTGKLNYPKGLKKGSIATVFLRKKAGKKDMNITSITLEDPELTKEEVDSTIKE